MQEVERGLAINTNDEAHEKITAKEIHVKFKHFFFLKHDEIVNHLSFIDLIWFAARCDRFELLIHVNIYV